MCCALCIWRSAKNNFTTGCGTMTQQEVKRHALQWHLQDLPALGAVASYGSLVSGFQRQLLDEESRVKKLLHHVYFLCKARVPLHLFPPLCHMTENVGLLLGAEYRNHMAAQ
jgi:hypothetical protein